MGRLSLNSRSLLREDNSQEEHSRSRGRTKMSQMYGCIATWIVLMELHFEEENYSKEQECSELAFDILLNLFESGVQGHQMMVSFEKGRQRDNVSIDKFLDDLELIKTRTNPDQRTLDKNLAMDSELMDGVKKEKLKTVLAIYFTFSVDSVPRPDDICMNTSP